MRANISLTKSASIGYRLKIDRRGFFTSTQLKSTQGSHKVTRNNTQVQYINPGLLFYQSIVLCKTICVRQSVY